MCMSSEFLLDKPKKTTSFANTSTLRQQRFFTDEALANKEEYNYKSYLNEQNRSISSSLSIIHQTRRINLFSWIYKLGKVNLQLKSKTIELAMVLFDYYCQLDCKRQMQNNTFVKKYKNKCKPIHILQYSENYQLTLLASLLSCSKYNQIYPPSLNNFSAIFNDKFDRQTIINKQLDIVQLTQFAFNITTVSNWYQYLFQQILPEWGFEFYILNYGINNQSIAIIIAEVQNQFQNQVEDSNSSSQKLKMALILFANSNKLQATEKKKAFQTDKRLKKK